MKSDKEINIDAPLTIGGFDHKIKIAGLRAKKNFVGCMSDVFYEMDYDLPVQDPALPTPSVLICERAIYI